MSRRPSPALDRLLRRKPVVAVVRLHGAIGSAGRFRPGLTLAGLSGVLERAFKTPRLIAVALTINSPGGAAAQSALIHRRIRALGQEAGVPVLAFGEDVVASGGYMLACAADEIYVDENSIVGSIGVISASFGFQDLIARIGVERRIHKAGAHKDMLDPFRPERPEDAARLEALHQDIHAAFIALVRERRGARLHESDDIFSGAFWGGQQAVARGLADGLGDLRSVLRDRFGPDVRFRLVEAHRPFWRRALPGVTAAVEPAGLAALGGLADAMVATVEERALWARYGL